MKTNLLAMTLALLAATALTSAADAQEITGAAGSPSATTTIPGNQLPPQGAPKDGAFNPTDYAMG
jgi:TolA-binding protein